MASPHVNVKGSGGKQSSGSEAILQDIKKIKGQIEQLQAMEVSGLLSVGIASTDVQGLPQAAQHTIANDTGALKRINAAANQRLQLFEQLNLAIAALELSSSDAKGKVKSNMANINQMESHLATQRQIASKIAQSTGSTVPGVDDTMMRKLELSTYQADKHRASIDFIKAIVYLAVPLILVVALIMHGVLDNSFGTFIAVIVILVGGYYCLKSFLDLFWRDNMNFNEFAWSWSKKDAESGSVSEYDASRWKNRQSMRSELQALASDLHECVGAECCGPGMSFNHSKDKCVEVEAFNA